MTAPLPAAILIICCILLGCLSDCDMEQQDLQIVPRWYRCQRYSRTTSNLGVRTRGGVSTCSAGYVTADLCFAFWGCAVCRSNFLDFGSIDFLCISFSWAIELVIVFFHLLREDFDPSWSTVCALRVVYVLACERFPLCMLVSEYC